MIELWEEYRETQSSEAFGRLLVHYRHLVREVAASMRNRLAAHVEQEDLTSYGMFGLIDAVKRFDASKGRFEAYAVTRIRGAIIDELRSLDWIPRTVHDGARQALAAEQELALRLGRMPTEVEVATETGLTRSQVQRLLASHEQRLMDTLSGDVPLSEGGTVSAGDLVADVSHVDLHDLDHLKASILSALDQLTPQSRLLLGLYYQEGLSMNDVGIVLGMGMSHVSQTYSAIMRQLLHGMENPGARLPSKMDSLG